MMLEYNKFSILNITKDHIEDYFVSLSDDYDASIFSTIRGEYISIIIFIEYNIWKSSKSISKDVSDCFIRLRNATDLIRIESRDFKTSIDKKEFWMISRKLTLK